MQFPKNRQGHFKMACGGSQFNAVSPTGGLEISTIDRLAHELYKSVKKDQLVRAKFLLKGLSKEDRKKIVIRTFDGNAPLFIAAQQGQLHFLNYLLDECFADIEQKGVYEVVEDRSRHKVTPLWCASVANKVEVVKSLLGHGANVNACSDTNSTPVRSACYMTNLEVVKVLVEQGADIHMANVNGGTCLINSVQSPDLCKYLIEKGTSVNAQDNSGNLALHYAIREGRLETVRLLLKHKSDPYVTNDFGDDAIQTASLRGYSDILEFLLAHPSVKPTQERTIEAYELMGTNYVDEKHDIQRAITAWRMAVEMRQRNNQSGSAGNMMEKPVAMDANPAYLGVVEARTMDELEEVATNPDSIYMQALLIRERILGPDHKDTVFGLMYRGAVYADTHRYQRCVDLWKYAFKLRHLKQDLLNPECIFTLQALCKLFWEIHEEFTAEYTQENVHFTDVCEVLDMAVTEIVNKPNESMDSNSSKGMGSTSKTSQSAFDSPVPVTGEEKHTMLLLVLHLIHLVCKIATDNDQRQRLATAVRKLIEANIIGNNGKSLLHLAVDNKISTVAEEFYSEFPSFEVVSLLIQCGCDVNGLDTDGNTVLHVCGEGLNQLLTQPKCRQNLEDIVEYLVLKGTHMDAVNAKGVNAGVTLQNQCSNIRLIDHVTLKCLAARVIRKENISFRGEIPVSLFSFVELH